MRELCDVCGKISRVVTGLACGSVEFVYDNYVPEGRAYHPAEILDDIFCDVADTLYEDPDAYVSDSQVEQLLKKLKQFRRCFRVAELMQPIGQLEQYLQARALPLAA